MRTIFGEHCSVTVTLQSAAYRQCSEKCIAVHVYTIFLRCVINLCNVNSQFCRLYLDWAQ